MILIYHYHITKNHTADSELPVLPKNREQTKPQNICAMCLCHTHQNILTQAHLKKKIKKKSYHN